MPSGPQCTVWGREYPARLASSSASMVRISFGWVGSGFVSKTWIREDRMPGTIDNDAQHADAVRWGTDTNYRHSNQSDEDHLRRRDQSVRRFVRTLRT